MKKLVVALCFLLSVNLTAQNQIILSSDTSVCVSYTGVLSALSDAVSPMATDDLHDAAVPIGFTFNFYGLPYTQLVVSGNGYITFDLTQANNYSPWAINAPIPNPGSVPQNAIMAPWQDINTGIGGSVYYGTSGIAPNRMFIVTWCAVPMFSCTSDLHTSQLILYEGSNKIEMYIQDKPLCLGWNGGAAIQGLVDATSTNFDIVNDPVLLLPRNWPLPWTATNEAWEFIPNTPASSYTINQLTYSPIIAGANTWYNMSGVALGTGSTLPINISTTTSYVASITGNCIGGVSTDTVTITISNPSVDLGPDISLACGTDTTIFPQCIGATPPYTYLWNTGAVDSFLLVDSSSVYSVNIIDSNGCSSNDNISITVSSSPSVSLGIDLIIPCGSNTLVDPVVSGGSFPYTYLWNTLQTDSVLALDTGVYYLTVTDIFGCLGVDTLEIIYDVPPSVSLGIDLIIPCGSNTLVDPVVSGGTLPYSYLWSTLQTDIMLDLDTGTYYLTVTDTFGCFGVDTLEIDYDPPPLIDFVFDGLPFDALLDTDTIACNSTNFYGPVSIVGGTSPFTYEWKDASGLQLGILDSIPLGDGTYYLTVTDTFGCFGVDTLEVIYDPPPTAEVKGGEGICDDGIEEAKVVFTFNGLLPWDLEFTDGGFNYLENNIIDTSYTYVTMNEGLYTIVMARDSNDCLSINSGSAEVVVYTLPVPVITPQEFTIYGNESVELVVGDYEVYDWYLLPSLESIATSPTLTVSDSGNYYVTVRDTNGCENFSDVAIVNLQPYTDLFIPNSFTPNGDEHNELFVIKGGYIVEFYIQIYNRWGEQLFESNDINKSWDGFYKNNLIPEGSYYYHLRVLGEDKRVVEKSGSINVIY